MIVLKLDSPIQREGVWIKELSLETPVKAHHLIAATAKGGNVQSVAFSFMESAYGLLPGELGQLSIEDFTKCLEAFQPFMASFERLNKETT